ncbi:hypothetical protein ACFY4C_12190 [Actinomadura viridis]|uniref:hypothetical protein n=1 Tax=Actinomadura viridis TaxID=58110 RepID=UPI0036821BF0
MALAAGLIGFGVNAIVSFEPHCVSSALFKCFSTVEEQRASNDRAALLPIGGGVLLLVLFVVLGVRGVLTTYRAHRARRF